MTHTGLVPARVSRNQGRATNAGANPGEATQQGPHALVTDNKPAVAAASKCFCVPLMLYDSSKRLDWA